MSARATDSGVRRSQAQRRALTIERLTNAVVHCLVTLGYSGTTTAAIAQQAGLSQGAIFRHFDSRQALLVATMEVIADRFIARYRDTVARIRASGADDISVAVLALRDVTRSHDQVAWFEVQQAARTDDALRAGFRPVFLRNQKENMDLARQLFPDTLATLPFFEDLVHMLIQVFHGQTLDAHIDDSGQRDQRVLDTLLVLGRAGLPAIGNLSDLGENADNHQHPHEKAKQDP
jgi:AcrR family transcriptional regulator